MSFEDFMTHFSDVDYVCIKVRGHSRAIYLSPYLCPYLSPYLSPYLRPGDWGEAQLSIPHHPISSPVFFSAP